MRRKPVIISVVLLIMMLTIASCSIYVYNKELRAVPSWLTGDWQSDSYVFDYLHISPTDISGSIGSKVGTHKISVRDDLRHNCYVSDEYVAENNKRYVLELRYTSHGWVRTKSFQFVYIDDNSIHVQYNEDNSIIVDEKFVRQ